VTSNHVRSVATWVAAAFTGAMLLAASGSIVPGM
jgi:hypothetical protein